MEQYGYPARYKVNHKFKKKFKFFFIILCFFTRLRLIVNDVREALTQTQVQIGSSEFSVSTLIEVS